MPPKKRGRKDSQDDQVKEEDLVLDLKKDQENDGDEQEESKKEDNGKDQKKFKGDEKGDDDGSDNKSEPLDSSNGTKPPVKEEIKKDVEVSTKSEPVIDDGILLLCGGTNWDLIGRKELPKSAAKQPPMPLNGKNLWGPHRWSVNQRIRVVASGCTACHSVIVTDDGKVMTWGRNDKGQLGQGDLVTRFEPVLVETLKEHNIVAAACGKGHTLFLTDKGVVYSCGDNKMGQLGIGSQSQHVLTPTKVQHSGKPIIKLACGGDFSMIISLDGNLYSFGSPENGQLGHNSEGKYFITSTKLAYQCETTPRKMVVFIEKTREGHIIPLSDVSIVDVACGVNHALAVDSRKRCFTWGFAGYGRLGHNDTKNELMPRNLKTFDYVNRGVKRVWAGSTFSMALDENGILYFWGQTKSSGDATMYPKPIQDLCGWSIKKVACSNKSIVVAADESLISWGPSPTYGELGYGENKNKSSTTPQEVKLLEGIHIMDVSCGMGHTLMIARNNSKEEDELINRLPQWP